MCLARGGCHIRRPVEGSVAVCGVRGQRILILFKYVYSFGSGGIDFFVAGFLRVSTSLSRLDTESMADADVVIRAGEQSGAACACVRRGLLRTKHGRPT